MKHERSITRDSEKNESTVQEEPAAVSLSKEALEALRQLTSRPISKEKDSCEVRPQLPGIAALENTCAIDLKKQFETVKSTHLKILDLNGAPKGSGFYACSVDNSICGVITNEHVVRGKDKILGKQDTGRSSELKVLHVDPFLDLALLEVQHKANAAPKSLNLNPVKYGTAVELNDSVFSVCSPTRELPFTFVTAGKVWSPSTIPLIDGVKGGSEPVIETRQLNFKGCSGGPNFNKWGELVGVVRAVLPVSRDHGMSLSIPAKDVKTFFEQYKFKTWALKRMSE